MEKFLSIGGFGNVHEGVFERGIILAREYFYENDLDFLKCYEAYEKEENSELGQHWVSAGRKANLVLYAFNLQNNSTLVLEIVDEEVY